MALVSGFCFDRSFLPFDLILENICSILNVSFFREFQDNMSIAKALSGVVGKVTLLVELNL